MPAVLDSPPKIFAVSPSQIATWKECKRKWAWKHIEKVEIPPQASATLGTDTHSQLETYLSGGEFDFTKPSGYFAESATHLLPAPKTEGIQLEKYFTLLSPDTGIKYHGYMDVVGPDSSVFPGIPSALSKGFLTPFPVVSDHKTTSNFAYAKTPEQLRTDPQGVIYAKAAFEMYPTALELDLIWTYMSTRGAKKSTRRHLHVLKNEVEEEFRKIELVASEITATHLAQTKPLDLPSSTDACGLYRGCPYQHLCTDISVLNPLGKTMSTEVDNMLKDLQSRIPQAEQQALFPRGIQGLIPGVQATLTATQATLSNIPPNNTLNWLTAPKDPGPRIAQEPVGPTVLDSFFLPTAPPSGASFNPPAQASAEYVTLDNPKGLAPINPEGSAVQPTSELDAKPEEKPAKVKATKATKKTQEVTSVPPVQVTGYVLYVNAYPQDGTPFTRAESLFDTAAQRLKTDTGFDDYRMIDYGKGAGVFATLVQEAAAGLQGNLVIDTRTPEGSVCVAGLVTKAAYVAARGF